MSKLNIAVKSLSRQQIRNLAQQVRKFTQIDNSSNYCVVDWFENKFIPKSDFNYDICDLGLMGDDHALTDHENNLIMIREDIYTGACNGMGRDRMTIVHEVGHCIMHVPERILHARSFTTEPPPTYQDPEWQAKAFAGEFMVPVGLLKEGMKVSELAEIFGVSLVAAEYQAKIYQRDGLIKLNGPVNDMTDPKIVWMK